MLPTVITWTDQSTGMCRERAGMRPPRQGTLRARSVGDLRQIYARDNEDNEVLGITVFARSGLAHEELAVGADGYHLLVVDDHQLSLVLLYFRSLARPIIILEAFQFFFA
jgi:hypothetical protein